MTMSAFNDVCDNLAANLDPSAHEDRRWAKNEGAKLAQVSAEVEQIFKQRDDFSIKKAEKQPIVKTAVSYVISLGADEVANLIVKLNHSFIVIYASDRDGAVASVPNGNPSPSKIELDGITPAKVAGAVAEAMREIHIF